MDDQATAAVEYPTTLNVYFRSPSVPREVVDFLLGHGRDTLDPDGELRRVGLSSWLGKDVRSRSVLSPVGQRHLAAALAEQPTILSLTMSAAQDPFFPPAGTTAVEVMVSFDQKNETGHLLVYVPSARSDRLSPFARLVDDRFDLLSGGAWNGPAGVGPVAWAPPWWRLKPLVDPVVAGPLWLLVVPAEGHRRLLASARACELAVGYQVLAHGGALWQLCDDPSGPQGAVLTEWEAIFADLGMTDTSWEKAHPKTGVVWTPPPR